jgi:cytochrome P450
MASYIKPTDNDFFTYGCDVLFKGATYVVKSTTAIMGIAKKALCNWWQGENIGSKILEIPELKPQTTFIEMYLDAEKGQAQPLCSNVYLDIQERSLGVAPKLKRIHVVNDQDMIKELFHVRRGDEYLDSGFNNDLEPIVTKDTMLLCPYLKHRNLRSPLELTFSKRTIQTEEMIFRLVNNAACSLSVAAQSKGIDAVQDFVLFSIIDQALGLTLSETEKSKLNELMKKAIGPESKKIRRELELFFVKVFKGKRYESGSGLEALMDSQIMSESEKISAAILMFGAGMHTTMNFIKIFLHELNRSGYNEKIYAEWQEFRDRKEMSRGHKPDTEFVQNSKLLHACYLEALRLYPVIPIIKRVAKKDFILGDTYIASGDEVYLNIMAAQRDSRHWGSNAGEFYPERFLNDQPHPWLFNFGLGSQSCIGRHLAELESKVMGAMFSIYLTHKSKKGEVGGRTPMFYGRFALSTKNLEGIDSSTYKMR